MFGMKLSPIEIALFFLAAAVVFVWSAVTWPFRWLFSRETPSFWWD